MSNFEKIKSMQEKVITNPLIKVEDNNIEGLEITNDEELYQVFLKFAMVAFAFLLMALVGQ